jgi:acetyl esterase
MTREDYKTLIDAEIWAFIDQSNHYFPPEVAHFPIEQQRATYNVMCRYFQNAVPARVQVHDITLDVNDRTLAVRCYRAAAIEIERGGDRPAILYFHGGGFILGDLDSHGDICADLCDGTGFDVFSVDYRLAPEHLHPAAFEDCCAAFEWLAATSDAPILLCGESAGGNLAAAVAHARRRQPRAAIGQMLIYPSLGSDMTGPSYRDHANAPLLTKEDVVFYRDVRGTMSEQADDPTTAPLSDNDFSGLPATVIITAQCDPLSSDGEAYRDRVVAAGGRAHWHEAPGLVHSFVRARHLSSRAGAAFSEIVVALAALGAGTWPYEQNHQAEEKSIQRRKKSGRVR